MWYFAENGQQQGPVSLADLQAMVRSGRLTIDSLVWRQGMNNWMPVQNVPELRLEADLAKRGKVGSVPVGSAPSPRPLRVSPPPAGASAPGTSPDSAGAPGEGAGMSPASEPFPSGAGAGSEPPPAAAAEPPSAFGPAVDFPDDATPRPLRPLASSAGAGHCVKCGAPLSTGHAGAGSEGGQGLCDTCRAAFAASLTPGAASGARAAVSGVSPLYYQYGGFMARFAASFCDGVILWVMSFAVTFVLSFGFALVGSSLHHEFGEVLDAMALLVSSLLGGILLPSFYHGYFLSTQGATPGKKLLGLAVIRPDGSTVSFLRGMCRFWATSISGMICGIGYLMALFDDEKRALHDHICDTRVVSSR